MLKHYSCNVCTKVFFRSDSLSVHLRSHTGAKPFTCALCAQRFSQDSTLKKHLSTDTNLKQFSCLQCSKTFKDVCTRHQENHFSGVHHVFRNSAQSCSVVEVPVQYLNTQENEQLQLLEIKTDIEFFGCKIGL